MFDLYFVMPVLAVFFVLIIVITVIITQSKQQTAIKIDSFESLAKELRQDNATLKKELLNVQEKVSSMEKMMNEIQ